MNADPPPLSNSSNNPPIPLRPAFTIGVSDKDEITLGAGDPSVPEARHIDFDAHINENVEPTAAQMEFRRNLLQVEHALNELYYPESKPAKETRFRPQFMRLFYLARLALEGDVEIVDGKRTVGKRLSDDAAKAEIAALAADLIEDEAPRIKNTHLRQLGGWAVVLAIPFGVAYVVLMLFGQPADDAAGLANVLTKLKINPVGTANFMLLWVGTFVGVCLSYAIRTHTFSLADLTRTDADYLGPAARLLLAGAFAMLLTLAAVLGLGELAIGSVKVSDVVVNPMLALLIGAVFGISEQKLTGTVEKRLGDLFGGATQ